MIEMIIFIDFLIISSLLSIQKAEVGFLSVK